MARLARLKKELELLEKDPPHGICCWPEQDQIDRLSGQIQGPKDSPYEGGTFDLEVNISERYPFEPPKVRFLSPIYHPNIDTEGRICLDILKMPPKGAWKPSLNVSTVLTSIQLLMAEPNPDDALMADIASEYKQNKQLFISKAKKQTQKFMEEKEKRDLLPVEEKETENQEKGKEKEKVGNEAEKRSSEGDETFRNQKRKLL